MCAPTVRLEIESVPTPALRVAVPITVVPSKNVTLPVGDTPLTVAVSMVAPPMMLGLTLDVSATELGAGKTCCATAEEVLCELFVSPL